MVLLLAKGCGVIIEILNNVSEDVKQVLDVVVRGSQLTSLLLATLQPLSYNVQTLFTTLTLLQNLHTLEIAPIQYIQRWDFLPHPLQFETRPEFPYTTHSLYDQRPSAPISIRPTTISALQLLVSLPSYMLLHTYEQTKHILFNYGCSDWLVRRSTSMSLVESYTYPSSILCSQPFQRTLYVGLLYSVRYTRVRQTTCFTPLRLYIVSNSVRTLRQRQNSVRTLRQRQNSVSIRSTARAPYDEYASYVERYQEFTKCLILQGLTKHRNKSNLRWLGDASASSSYADCLCCAIDVRDL